MCFYKRQLTRPVLVGQAADCSKQTINKRSYRTSTTEYQQYSQEQEDEDDGRQPKFLSFFQKMPEVC